MKELSVELRFSFNTIQVLRNCKFDSEIRRVELTKLRSNVINQQSQQYSCNKIELFWNSCLVDSNNSNSFTSTPLISLEY